MGQILSKKKLGMYVFNKFYIFTSVLNDGLENRWEFRYFDSAELKPVYKL